MRVRWQSKLRALFPACALLAYGSSVTGMAAHVSDLDLCLKFDRDTGASDAVQAHLNMTHGEVVECIAQPELAQWSSSKTQRKASG